VPYQSPALVARGERRVAVTIHTTLRAQRFTRQRLLEHGRWPQLPVILDTPLAATIIPAMHRLICFARQLRTPTGIDAEGAQHLAGQGVDRGEVGGRQSWIAAGNRSASKVICCSVDMRFSRCSDGRAAIADGSHRHAAWINGLQRRGGSVQVRHLYGHSVSISFGISKQPTITKFT
jgi:hypothetical protein